MFVIVFISFNLIANLSLFFIFSLIFIESFISCSALSTIILQLFLLFSTNCFPNNFIFLSYFISYIIVISFNFFSSFFKNFLFSSSLKIFFISSTFCLFSISSFVFFSISSSFTSFSISSSLILLNSIIAYIIKVPLFNSYLLWEP